MPHELHNAFVVLKKQYSSIICYSIQRYSKYLKTSTTLSPVISPCAFFRPRFVCKNNGVLFENDLIQIGVKSEFRQNLGRIGLFYGNKTQQALLNFQPQLSWAEENQVKLAVQVKPVDSVLEAGAQIQQLINAECIDDYNGNSPT